MGLVGAVYHSFGVGFVGATKCVIGADPADGLCAAVCIGSAVVYIEVKGRSAGRTVV
ncbi:hypothetical protein SDC9_73581 [bioreactor metagenome]|uniref:Uncharacterized protein n=1 Tax=bioreactor metagenome TaxID=1076179 RepID=A0A644YEZ6_9ZZZZ